MGYVTKELGLSTQQEQRIFLSICPASCAMDIQDSFSGAKVVGMGSI
jgi:hypothetical protein